MPLSLKILLGFAGTIILIGPALWLFGKGCCGLGWCLGKLADSLGGLNR